MEKKSNKGKIILVHIEPLEERYSKQWLEDLMPKVDTILGSVEEKQIITGEFLDVYETNYFKLEQGLSIINYVQETKLTKDDTFLFLDLWNPVVCNLAYVRDCMGMEFQIAGLLHAGTWDKWDFLSRSGLGKWAKGLESSMILAADKVIVATQFHKDIIQKDLGEFSNIIVEDFPIFTPKYNIEKDNIVVFPHRLAVEKDELAFDKVEQMYRKKYPDAEVKFIKTVNECTCKEEYYMLLAAAKVSFSSAKQETFGIAMLESLNMGCIPVAPNRLSYKETLPDYLYDSLDEAVDMIHKGLFQYKKPKPYTINNFDKILKQL